MENLDGKDVIKPVAFDAHEQATRGEHVPTAKDSPDLDPEKVVEFPKAVDHVQKDNAPEGHLEPVLVNSAEEEKAYLASNADENADPKADNLSEMSKADRKQELGGMKKAELLDVAAQHDVQADDSMNKGEITSAINKKINKEATA